MILALPRRSIELIDWEHKHDPWLATNLKSVVPQKALKLLVGYEYPWWRPLGLRAGVSVTDMPIRQSLYFQTEGEFGGDPRNDSSLLLGSYNDMVTIPFWKALESGEPFEGRRTAWIDRGENPVPGAEFTVTREMVDAIQRQLRVLHDLRRIPEPYTAIYHEWSGDSYGGGWHAWKAGFKFNEVMRTGCTGHRSARRPPTSSVRRARFRPAARGGNHARNEPGTDASRVRRSVQRRRPGRAACAV